MIDRPEGPPPETRIRRAVSLLIVPPVLNLLQELAGSSSRRFLPRIRQLTASYRRGKLHRAYFSCGVLMAPLRTPTRPPATHTNAYLVGHRKLYLIDPGSRDPAQQEKLWELLDDLLAEKRSLEGILLTHHHPDHVGGVEACQGRYGVPVYGHRLTADRLPAIRFAGHLEHGQELPLGVAPDGTTDWRLRVYHLPGHAPGHLAFEENRYGAVLVGDLISTLSSILIDPADGHLSSYIKSLEALQSLAGGHLYPAHGPPARDGRRAVLRALEHRRKRERQLLEALAKGPRAADDLVRLVYGELDEAQQALARRSLLAGLLKLQEEGRVKRSGDDYQLSRGG